MELFGPTYQVIYADPPWQYGSGGARGGRYGELDYPTMPTADICALPVSLLAADDAALFLWFTGSFMAEALAVCSAWGFRFVRIDKVWAKKTRNGNAHAVVGPWGMSDAEFLLLGVRGSMASAQAERNQYTVVDEPYPGRHSAKPEVFRRQIEARFPNARRLELFARDKAEGWDVWGNEVGTTIPTPLLEIFDPRDERAVCKQHPTELAEWMGELCQECWEELCAGDWWAMLRRAGL